MERLKQFDENGHVIGEMTRAVAHEKGYWHETFHCWLTSIVDGEAVVLLQLRSSEKKDYASLYDITAAGHLMAHETILDGLREVEEELGLFLRIEAYESMGTFPNVILSDTIQDREWARCFTAAVPRETAFTLQIEEVEKIVYCRISDFYQLIEGICPSITIWNWLDDHEAYLTMRQMVPHPRTYFQAIATHWQAQKRQGE
ncbi:NUDIX hydrolase [Kurthia senegalensis]|uniref:NUDIX hydrolase n=1 Tax=Kurthia senegalensis TaxID=1033740 RepID=UPI000289D4D1|nr:NUDIX domain-containing protein [Kurthia senegalensis]